MQAVLLGVAATLSHTAVVWAVAFGGMYLFSSVDAEASEPYFQVASAVLIIAIATWMLRRTWNEQQEAKAAKAAAARAEQERPGLRKVDTGHGFVGLELTTDASGDAYWHLRTLTGNPWSHEDVTIAVTFPDGRRRTYHMEERDGFLQSADPVPAPHVFTATLNFSHGDHDHGYDVEYTGEESVGLIMDNGEYQDAHQRAHAEDIKKRFTNRSVTTGQIVMFGLTGGLIPCPAAITVLLLCLQVKQLVIGAVLVMAFSVGLAMTMVTAGVVASLSVRHIAKRWSGFGMIAERAPYFSSGLIIVMGLYLGIEGLRALSAAGAI
jgi:nickel/cobalt exporter